MKRKIINIDENKCNGCGQCVPDCPEGALQIIDGKARLVSDLFCDGLGACIGSCPQGAVTVLEREAEPYDEKKVMDNIVKQGGPVIIAHLEHLVNHGETVLYNQAVEYMEENNINIPKHEGIKSQMHIHEQHACPGSAIFSFDKEKKSANQSNENATTIDSELRQWPVQLKLLNPAAPYFNNSDLLMVSDCVPFAYADFHRDFLRNKVVVMFCPKLDPYIDEYIEKMTAILSNHKINSITVVKMEVPCCGGINHVLEEALRRSGKKIPLRNYTITVEGKVA